MISGLDKNAEYESTIVNEFITNEENTMDLVVSSSVGMALLYLKEIYFSINPDQGMINQQYKQCINELMAITDERLQCIIKYIIAKSEKDINQLDVVTLYLFSEKTQCYEYCQHVFPLSEVLTLVWNAINDDQKYMWAYEGNAVEKLEKAKADRAKRLEVLFNRINELEADRVCHHGVRNELVFCLNGAYADLDVIEDSKGTIIAFLRDRMESLFWKKYKTNLSINDKRMLIHLLSIWFNEGNPSLLIEWIDPNFKKTMTSELSALFLKHGSNPEDINLEKKITEALPYISFSCDPKLYPNLAKLKIIFGAHEENERVSGALLLIQRWVIEKYQADDPDLERQLTEICTIYQAYSNLIKHGLLLSLNDKLTDEHQRIEVFCHSYFKALNDNDTLSIVPNELFNAISNLNDLVEQCKNDETIITRFLSDWFGANDWREIRLLYSLLLRDSFQDRVCLPDNKINQFLSVADGGEFNSYQINRMFLIAILREPQEWNVTFAEGLKRILEFLDKKGTQGSLPVQIVNQVLYLYLQYQNEEFPRPSLMILLPQHVKNAMEWVFVSGLLDKKRHQQIYQALAIKINKILVDWLNQGLEDDFESFFFESDFNIALPDASPMSLLIESIPRDKQSIFLFQHGEKIQSKIKNEEDLEGLILRLDPSHRLAFLRQVGVNFVQGIISNGLAFANLLKWIPEDDQFLFMQEFFLCHIFTNKDCLNKIWDRLFEPARIDFAKKICKDFFYLNYILEALNRSLMDKIYFISMLGVEYVKNAVNSKNDFYSILEYFRKGEMIHFFHLLGIDFIKKFICDEFSLVHFLKMLNEEDRFAFLKEFGSEFSVFLIQKYSDSCTYILRNLPLNDRYHFLQFVQYKSYVNSRELNDCINLLSPSERFPCAREFGLICLRNVHLIDIPKSERVFVKKIFELHDLLRTDLDRIKKSRDSCFSFFMDSKKTKQKIKKLKDVLKELDKLDSLDSLAKMTDDLAKDPILTQSRNRLSSRSFFGCTTKKHIEKFMVSTFPLAYANKK